MSNFPERREKYDTGGVEMQDCGMFVSVCFGYGAIRSPMENIQAIARAVAPFRIRRDPW